MAQRYLSSGGFDGGGAFLFSKAGDYISIPSSASVMGKLSATITLWYKPESNPNYGMPVYYESTETCGGCVRFAIWHNSDGYIEGKLGDIQQNPTFSAKKTNWFTTGVTVSAWHYLVLTFDANAGTNDYETLCSNEITIPTP